MNQEAIARVEQQQREMMEKYGWIVHYIFETDHAELNGMMNAHTHGLAEKYNFYDLQIVVPLPQEIAHSIFCNFVYRFEAGERFSTNTKIDNIVSGFSVMLQSCTEGGRILLRIILPDQHGYFPSDPDCDIHFALQALPLPE